jgi:hypothetical protein
VYEPVKQTSIESTQGQDLRTMSTSPTVSTVGPKAYIFVEPQTKTGMIVNHLNKLTRNPQSSGSRFYAFFNATGINSNNFNDLINYFDMPHWYDGRLPSVIEAEIPQVSGGTDSHGNTKTAYNFTTVKIPKNTVSGLGWINILIPVSAMSNDTKRQKTIYTYEKIGNTLVTNGTVKGRSYNMNSVMYSYTFNYQGNRIPKGVYRLYTTYPDPGNRANLNTTKDYYLRGNGN